MICKIILSTEPHQQSQDRHWFWPNSSDQCFLPASSAVWHRNHERPLHKYWRLALLPFKMQASGTVLIQDCLKGDQWSKTWLLVSPNPFQSVGPGINQTTIWILTLILASKVALGNLGNFAKLWFPANIPHPSGFLEKFNEIMHVKHETVSSV